MKRITVAVVCIALILACSSEENLSIENTDDNGGSLINTENLIEQFSAQNNIPEKTYERTGPQSRIGVEVFPVCMYRPLPDYPDSARNAGIEGMVTLWLYIDSVGTVKKVGIYNSSGTEILDLAAISAVWNTEWTPAQRMGVGVGVWTTFSYRFELD